MTRSSFFRYSFLSFCVSAALTLAAWAQIGVPRFCDRGPVLFEDDNFRGESLPADESISDLHDLDFGDKASSICVPSGWRVTIYEDDRFRGDGFEIHGPEEIRDLKRDKPGGRDWGDRISSIDVRRVRRFHGQVPRECETFPMLFEDDSFRDDSIRLDRDIPDLHDRGFGDDASSVCVPRGWEVELFEDEGYRGDRLVVRGEDAIADLKRDRPGGRDWGDRISSVRVLPPRDQGRDPYPGRGPGRYPPPNDDERRNRSRDCSRNPVIYSDEEYGGRAMALRGSIADLHEQGWRDDISSICVPRGWRVILYEHANFRGARLDLVGHQVIFDMQADRPNGQDWDNRVSSLRVYSPDRRR